MTTSSLPGVQEKFAHVRAELADALIEREEEIDLVLTGLIARENPLLVGPPGTAKSMLLDSIMRWMGGGETFSILLTKFTTPEEVFGPISIKGLKDDRYYRVTDGYLPTADGAFIDEIFKASSAILNTLLKILNERSYDGCPVPLKLCVAASNEWPTGENRQELGALFDRFLLRKSVRPIATAKGRAKLLWGGDHVPMLSTRVTPFELDQAHGEAMLLDWSEEAKDCADDILRELAAEGIRPGDRRQYKSIAVAKAFAWLCGAAQVEKEHLEILAHTLWESPEEQPHKCAQIVAKLANPIGMQITSILLEVEEILAKLDIKNLSSCATATSKLGEISKSLAKIPGGNGRVQKAKDYVAEQTKTIKRACVEAM